MVSRPDHGEQSYRGSGRLLGPKALITGGDSGMGRAAAIAYAREGADVAINYYPTEEADAREIALMGHRIARRSAQRGVLHGAGRRRGKPARRARHRRQQRVSAAGARLVPGHHVEAFDATIKTNIYAPFWILKATDPTPDLYGYAMTKAATTNYVRSRDKQRASKGIRVNGVAPGPIWTPLQVSGGASQDKLKKFGGQTPMGRPGQPAELASIYVQLAAADVSYATGQVYGSSGGAGLP